VLLAMLGFDSSQRWRLGGSANTAVTHLRRGPHGWRLMSYNVSVGASLPPGAHSDLGGDASAKQRERDDRGPIL
jgi:hypothetical protein